VCAQQGGRETIDDRADATAVTSTPTLTKSRAGLAAGTLAVAVGVALLAAPGTAQAVKPTDPGTLTMAVYGDAPYGIKPGDDAQVKATPAFIAAVNADPDVSTVVHVGDIHSGKTFCTEAYDRTVAQLWTGYAQSLVYTPGDNEWSDCHKPGEGGGLLNLDGTPVDYAGGDPLANLDLVRSIFFAHPGQTLGNGNLQVQSQADHFDAAHPEDATYVENVMWQRKGVQFVTVNIPGGSNNDADPWFGAATASDRQSAERTARTAADLRWIDAAFARASSDGARGVVVIEQADMWDVDGKSPAHLTNYEPFVASLAAHTNAFGGPVLLFDGDSHVYRSDNPFSATSPCETEGTTAGTTVPCVNAATEAASHPGYTVPSFHRVTVHGSTFPLEWLKLTIDPRAAATGPEAFGPFSWQRMTTSITH
jgi:hypothetical protein